MTEDREPMEPLEVFVRYPDGKEKITGHACGACGIFNSTMSFIGTEEEVLERTKDAARRCCNPMCEDCGAKTERYHTLCRECQTKRFNEKANKGEAERRAKAQKISWRDYEGGGVFCGDTFFASVDDVRDCCECDGAEEPEYVWGATALHFRIDADWVLENALEDHYDGAGDNIGNDDIQELQKLLDGWCEKQGVVSYETDWDTLVILSEPEPDDDEAASDPSRS